MHDDEQAIRDLVVAWLDATRKGDTPRLLTLMADDVIFMVPGKEPFGKEAFEASAGAMKNLGIDGASEIQELKVTGDWAWVRNRLIVKITPPNGAPLIRSGHTLTILRKKPDGCWVIARDANLLS